ncbi:MAG: penicillin-insensitive murein endopeptidase [Sandaracinaceae bacterium]
MWRGLRAWCCQAQSVPRSLTIACALALNGCYAFPMAPDQVQSIGVTNHGVLRGGTPLPDSGQGYVRARRGEATRYGIPRLVQLLQRAAADVASAYPGTAPLRIGDLSAPGGGRHPRHGSHRTGRDADVLFYARDAAGRSVASRGWVAFNHLGFGVDRRDGRRQLWFDDARNWHLVRSLLLDPEAGTQWIFVSRGTKARLLTYAVANETDSRALLRAAHVLHQPSRGSPHDDHFHLRILCDPEGIAARCRHRGPIWPWLRGKWEKAPSDAVEPLDDEALLDSLVGEPG